MFIFFSFPILLWMPVEDYATQPFNKKQELFNYVAKICLSKSEKNYAGFSPLATTTGSGKTSYSTSMIKVWNTLSLHNQMYKVGFYVHNTMIETLEGLVILYRMSYLVYIYLLCYTSKCGFLYNKVNQQRYNLFLFLFFMNNKDVIWYLFMHIILRKFNVCLFMPCIMQCTRA